jgi:hypothetical protein
MSASTTPPLHVLRGILRHLKVKAEIAKSITTPPATMTYVLNQYRASRSISSPEKLAELRYFAYDYYQLQKDLQERARLYEMDAGADVKLTPKELSRRAAARAGLQLPKLDPSLK